MASFVIHHIAATRLLEVLSDKCDINFTEEEKNQFLLGNLIVDSVKTKMDIPDNLDEEEVKRIRKELKVKIQQEKVATHFRDENDSALTIQTPKIDKFIDKYINLLSNNDLSTLGYLFHLYTDKMFFADLFNDTFECLNKDKNPTIYLKETDTVRVKKNNEIHKAMDFFDNNYPYSLYIDYTTINKILLEHYNVFFNKKELLNSTTNFYNPGIEEVAYNNITSIINKTDSNIKDSYESTDTKLNVFDENKIKNFVEEIANTFILEYYHLIKPSGKKLIKK